MKFFKLAALSAAILAAASTSHAAVQTWAKSSAGNFHLSSSISNSGTTPVPLVSVDSARQTVVWISSTNPINVNVNRTLSNGTILSTVSVAVTSTPISVTFAAPQAHQAIMVSRTGVVTGTDTIHQTVVQSK